MPQILVAFRSNASTGRLGFAGLIVALVLGLASCKDKTDVAPETGTDYYPVAVGNFWVYAVADTTWSQATQGVPSVPKASAYRFRERITEELTDAAGQKAYRLVRSKRASATAAWADDSAFVLTATPQFVALNRNNAKTVELIFPLKEGRSWNLNAFNNNSNDTITAQTRRYSRMGQPFVTGGGTSGPLAATYAATITTDNTGTAAENSLLRRVSYQQVFAKGVGPVFRRRLNFLNFNYADSKGIQVFPLNSYSIAFSRRETLIDYGPR